MKLLLLLGYLLLFAQIVALFSFEMCCSVFFHFRFIISRQWKSRVTANNIVNSSESNEQWFQAFWGTWSLDKMSVEGSQDFVIWRVLIEPLEAAKFWGTGARVLFQKSD